MAERSVAEGVAKFGLGLGVGFGLYLLIQNLGFGGDLGFGGARGDDRGKETPPMPPPMPPPIPRDDQRLEFVMVGPTTIADKKAAFRGTGGEIYGLDEMIARIKAGGRIDMTLKVRGDVITGPVATAEEQIKREGIEIWKPAPAPLYPEKQGAPHVSGNGNGRGQYGHVRGGR